MAAAACADLPPAVQAKVDQAKEGLAKEVKNEIAVRHMTCLRDYGAAGACGDDDNTCNATLAAVSDINRDWELSPLLLKGEHGEWIQDCQLWE